MEDSPIAKLHRDLLWQIFTIITTLDLPKIGQRFDTYSSCPSPLTTAHHISQVCASWRQLIIDSPSLWGNIIDLRSLRQESDTWRNEVLLRTGNSNLSIFGDICGKGWQHAKKFLEILLKNHWTRIQWVQVEFNDFDIVEWLQPDNGAWSALGRPVPNLRFFSIRFVHNARPPSICSSPGFILFANHAPLLAHFQQNHLPINLEASWTSSLISLGLDSASNLKLSDLLETCSRMRSLQTLRLMFEYGQTKSPSLEGTLHHVKMPSLSTLVIGSPLDVSLAFLDHITPAPGCSFELFVDLNTQTITPTEFVVGQRIIAKFANNYFCHWHATSFQLEIRPEFLRVGDTRGFTVSIYGSTTIPIPPFLPQALLGTFEPAHTSGVKTLWVTTRALIHIINLHNGDDQQCPFPQIKTLKWEPDLFPDCTSLIMNFLATRQKLGMPIEIFDFTEWRGSLPIPVDTKMLEEIPGLKVLLREKDKGQDTPRAYVCGSGRPQVLDAADTS